MINRAVIKAVKRSLWLPFVVMSAQILVMKSYWKENQSNNDLTQTQTVSTRRSAAVKIDECAKQLLQVNSSVFSTPQFVKIYRDYLKCKPQMEHYLNLIDSKEGFILFKPFTFLTKNFIGRA